MSVVAFIPVRGGSKSIPKKNIKNIAGKPLVQWVVEAAVNCQLIDEIYVSTDSEEIKSVIQNLRLPTVKVVGRGEFTATDIASTESALLEFTEKYNFKSVVLIQATSPLLRSEDLKGGLDLHFEESDCVLSVVRQKRFIWTKGEKDVVRPFNYDVHNRPRRQDFDGFLVENGAFYISTREKLLKSQNRISGNIKAYVMPEETYFEIDEPSDWVITEHLLIKQLESKPETITTKQVKLFLTDVDGVLTDACMYYSENGDELKKFNTHDGMAFKMLQEAGIRTGIITSEDTKLVEKRAKKLKADFLYQGRQHGSKLDAAKEICEQMNICLDEVAYIGDDINCMELLTAVGLAACPSNATRKIRDIKNIMHLNSKGGDGAVREFVEFLLLENGRHQA